MGKYFGIIGGEDNDKDDDGDDDNDDDIDESVLSQKMSRMMLICDFRGTKRSQHGKRCHLVG